MIIFTTLKEPTFNFVDFLILLIWVYFSLYYIEIEILVSLHILIQLLKMEIEITRLQYSNCVHFSTIIFLLSAALAAALKIFDMSLSSHNLKIFSDLIVI